MITPQEAARIAKENPNEQFQWLIERTEEEIENAAKNGRHKARICCTDNNMGREAARFFEREGWNVGIESEVSGGIRQYPAYFVYW